MFIYGLLILLGVSSGSQSLLQPLKGLFNGNAIMGQDFKPMQLAFKPVSNKEQLEIALVKARAEKKLVMLDFTAEWCIECKRLEMNVFSAPAIIKALEGFILLQADVTANSNSDQAFQKALKVVGPPTLLFFGPDGLESTEHRFVGYIKPEDFLVHINQLQKAVQQ